MRTRPRPSGDPPPERPSRSRRRSASPRPTPASTTPQAPPNPKPPARRRTVALPVMITAGRRRRTATRIGLRRASRPPGAVAQPAVIAEALPVGSRVGDRPSGLGWVTAAPFGLGHPFGPPGCLHDPCDGSPGPWAAKERAWAWQAVARTRVAVRQGPEGARPRADLPWPAPGGRSPFTTWAGWPAAARGRRPGPGPSSARRAGSCR